MTKKQMLYASMRLLGSIMAAGSQAVNYAEGMPRSASSYPLSIYPQQDCFATSARDS